MHLKQISKLSHKCETENLTSPELLTKFLTKGVLADQDHHDKNFVCLLQIIVFTFDLTRSSIKLALITLIHFNQKLYLEEGEKNDIIVKTFSLEILYLKK